MTVYYNYSDEPEIRELLIGRTVTKVADDKLLLDNGTELTLVGNDGCGGCSNGAYSLVELNGVDNIITNVQFLNDGDDINGVYSIFVYANNAKVNLATFEGGDGNGYYGSGYYITVKEAGR